MKTPLLLPGKGWGAWGSVVDTFIRAKVPCAVVKGLPQNKTINYYCRCCIDSVIRKRRENGDHRFDRVHTTIRGETLYLINGALVEELEIVWEC